MNFFQKLKLKILSRKKRTSVYFYFLYKFFYLFMDLMFIMPLFFLSGLSILKKKKMIGIGPVPLINSIFHKKCLEKYGYNCETFVDSIWHITEDFDYKPSQRLNFFFQPFIPYILFVRSIFKYNCIYIYFSGGPLRLTTLLVFLEPYLLKLAKIKVVCMAFGSDVQVHTRIKNLKFKDALSKDYPGLRLYKNQIDRLVTLWTNNSDYILAGADWVEYLYYWDEVLLGHFAIDLDEWKFIGLEQKDKKETVRFLHAPNHKNIKGSYFIQKAINDLKDEGYNVHLEICENMKNEQVKKEIAKADIVIDQLIVGFYAMFSIEAMASGKITVCNIRDDFYDFYEFKNLLSSKDFPIINANTKNIKHIIKNLLDNRENWNSISLKSREYVINNHSIEKIGKIFDKININIGVKK